jgi:hypothetical protein
MTKQDMLKYARKMGKDDEVFAIIYSKDDVKEWFAREAPSRMPTASEIADKLRCWEDNMDLTCTTCLATDFDDLCQELFDGQIKGGKNGQAKN